MDATTHISSALTLLKQAQGELHQARLSLRRLPDRSSMLRDVLHQAGLSIGQAEGHLEFCAPFAALHAAPAPAAETAQLQLTREPRSKTGLRPCPFCGQVELSRISWPKTETRPGCLLLQCDTCGATGPLGQTEAEIRAKWDMRSTPV